MAIEIVEGDFVVPGHRGKELLRMSFSGGDFWFRTHQQASWTLASVIEAKELRDWLTRRLDEEAQ